MFTAEAIHTWKFHLRSYVYPLEGIFVCVCLYSCMFDIALPGLEVSSSEMEISEMQCLINVE